MADRDERVLQMRAARMMRVHVAGRDRVRAEVARKLPELRVPPRVAALVRPLQLDVERVAERTRSWPESADSRNHWPSVVASDAGRLSYPTSAARSRIAHERVSMKIGRASGPRRRRWAMTAS